MGILDQLQDIHFKPIPWSLVKFPPDSAPTVLPPPSGHPALSHPFTIPTNVYNAALKAQVPITIAITYAATAILLNRYNARQGNKPWPISRTKGFYQFVIAHNVFLALYSAWTCLGMFNALRTALPSFREDNTLVKTVDAFCKMQGPRGLGSAATFNSTRGSWGVTDRAVHLNEYGLPESSDIGRIWNEGLAFYGWLFYLSKFYEVVDTLIILAKGKRSSTLQTYHHAGAMMSMWAGMRYMAPPIWMFVFVNSGIHAMMVRSSSCLRFLTDFISTPITHLPHSAIESRHESSVPLQLCKSSNSSSELFSHSLTSSSHTKSQSQYHTSSPWQT